MHDFIQPHLLGNNPWNTDSSSLRLFLHKMANQIDCEYYEVDQAKLAEWLIGNELGAFAFYQFKNVQHSGFLTYLQGTYWKSIAEITLKLNAVENILLRLSSVGVKCVLLKGISMAIIVYDMPAMREMNDIDLWIRFEDVPVVWSIMKELGFRDDGLWNSVDEIPEYITELSFFPSSTKELNCTVEIHWDLFARPGLINKLPLNTWWNRTLSIRWRNLEVNVLHPMDMLVHACLHQVLQHQNELRFRWLLDIDRLIRGNKKFLLFSEDWKNIIYETQTYDMWSETALALRSTKYWFNTPLPSIVQQEMENIRQYSHDFPIENDVSMDQRIASFSNVISKFKDIRNPSSKFRYIKDLLFPNKRYMLRKYKIRNHGILPIFYFQRLLKGISLLIGFLWVKSMYLLNFVIRIFKTDK